MTTLALAGLRALEQAGLALQELLHAGARRVALPPPGRADPRVHRRSRFKKTPALVDANTRALQGGLPLRRDLRDVRDAVRGQAGADRAGRLSQHHRQQRARDRPRGRGATRRPAALPRARIRSRRRATSCTSCRATRSSTSSPSRPRTRSPASVRPSARRSAARSASPRPADPGIDLKSETVGLAVKVELPLIICDIQRGGPSTGLPTKTEQADLLAALYGRHGESPVPVIAASSPARLLRGRARGSAHRRQVHDAGLPAVRRIPRQRRGAVAAARRSTSCPRSRWSSHRSRTATSRTCATPRRCRGPWVVPGHAGARASHRWPRVRVPDRQHQLCAGQPRADGPPARQEDRRHRPRDPADRGRRAPSAATSCCSAGAAPTARSPRRRASWSPRG